MKTVPEKNSWWHGKGIIFESGYLVSTKDSDIYSFDKVFDDYYKIRDSSIIPPYIELINAFESIDPDLLERLQNNSDEDDELINEQLTPIIQWIENYGPLGIMLHESMNIIQKINTSASIVDSWSESSGWSRLCFNGTARTTFEKIHVEYSPDRDGEEADDYGIKVRIELNPISDSEEKRTIKRMKFLMGEGNDIDYIKEFFDSSYYENSEEMTFPQPLSDLFITHYREPMALFIQGANWLRSTLTDVMNPKKRSAGLQELQYLSNPARLIAKEGSYSDNFTLGIQAPSLLSFLAKWAIIDIVSNNIFRCTECGKIHSSAAIKTLFCSSKCRFANSQRTYRAKNKAKKLHEKGLKFSEIATKIGRDLADVQKWLEPQK